MKKIIAVIMSVFMLVSATFVSAAAPEFMTSKINNCTVDYDVSIKFNSSSDLVNLLNEMEMPEEVGYFVDMQALLSTLMSYDGKMNTKIDMSDDYSKIKMSFTSDSNHNIDVNSNLKIGIDAKSGMWIDMDLSDNENPDFDMVIQTPFMDKYFKMSSEDIYKEVEESKISIPSINSEYVDSMQKTYADIFAKYATIIGRGTSYTIKMDNDAFVSYIDEVVDSIYDMMVENGYDPDVEIPSLKGLQILGKDGLTAKVILSGGKIKTEEIKADVSVNLSQIYTYLYGEEWEYTSKGIIDFDIQLKANVGNMEKTKVDFPVLTDENSFTVSDLENDYDDEYYYDEYYEEEPLYPYYYAYGSCDYLPVVNDEIYFPLRQTMEYAYEDNINIGFYDNKITMSSEYFGRCETIQFDVNSEIVLLDGEAYRMSKPVVINGCTYVGRTFFEEVFGWRLYYAYHDLEGKVYEYEFFTDNY